MKTYNTTDNIKMFYLQLYINSKKWTIQTNPVLINHFKISAIKLSKQAATSDNHVN